MQFLSLIFTQDEKIHELWDSFYAAKFLCLSVLYIIFVQLDNITDDPPEDTELISDSNLFHIIPVTVDAHQELDQFVPNYRIGHAYYEFVSKEDIPSDREVILMNKVCCDNMCSCMQYVDLIIKH